MKNNDNNNDNSDWMHGLYRLSDARRRQIISDRFKLNDDKRELLARNASQLGNQLPAKFQFVALLSKADKHILFSVSDARNPIRFRLYK